MNALETEWALLRLLSSMGAAVPEPLAVDDEFGLLVSSWIDGETLDDVCQRDPTLAAGPAPVALAALSHIERAMDARAAEVAPYVFDLDYDAYVGEDFDQYAQLAWTGFQDLAATPDFSESECRAAWGEAVEVIRSAQPTLGPLDYNARNLLLRGADPYFVDFSTVGWDWPERRVVQYFTALGAYREDGNFVSAVTRDTIAASRSVLFFNPDALEAHQVVFLCLAVARLLRIGIKPRADGIDGENLGWANRRRRFETVVGLLTSDGLTDLAPTQRLRQELRDRLHS